MKAGRRDFAERRIWVPAGKADSLNGHRKERSRRLRLPLPYTWPLLALAFALNLGAYYATTWLNAGRQYHVIALPLDEQVPLIAPFVAFYVLAYIQWIVGYWLVACDEERVFRRVLVGDIVAKLITTAIFMLLPTTMARPEIVGRGFFERVIALIYRIDPPKNLFPSIHCLESWICFRASLWMTRVPRWYRWGSLVLTLLVFASTVLIRQHLLVDIPAGVAVAELGLLASGKLINRSKKVWDG